MGSEEGGQRELPPQKSAYVALCPIALLAISIDSAGSKICPASNDETQSDVYCRCVLGLLIYDDFCTTAVLQQGRCELQGWVEYG